MFWAFPDQTQGKTAEKIAYRSSLLGSIPELNYANEFVRLLLKELARLLNQKRGLIKLDREREYMKHMLCYIQTLVVTF